MLYMSQVKRNNNVPPKIHMINPSNNDGYHNRINLNLGSKTMEIPIKEKHENKSLQC